MGSSRAADIIDVIDTDFGRGSFVVRVVFGEIIIEKVKLR